MSTNSPSISIRIIIIVNTIVNTHYCLITIITIHDHNDEPQGPGTLFFVPRAQLVTHGTGQETEIGHAYPDSHLLQTEHPCFTLPQWS